MKVLHDLVTGIDGETHDLGRWGAIIAFATGIGLQVYTVVWKAQPFSFTDFGVGVGSLAAGVGAMLRLKSNTEPAAKV